MSASGIEGKVNVKLPGRVRILGSSRTGLVRGGWPENSVATQRQPPASQAKLASLIPFARVAELLADVLPASEGLNAETVRTRVGRMGRRLEDEKVREWFIHARAPDPEVLLQYPYYRRRHLNATVGLDCGHVRNRHPRPEHHFEVVAGRARAPDGTSRCFAFGRTRAFLCPRHVQEAVAAVGGDLRGVSPGRRPAASLPSARLSPKVAGVIQSPRSTDAISCSTACPASASATTFTVQRIGCPLAARPRLRISR